MNDWLSPERALPVDRSRAVLVGRAWRPDVGGPSPVTVQGEDVLDLSPVAPTSSDLLNLENPVAAIRAAGPLDAHRLGRRSARQRRRRRARRVAAVAAGARAISRPSRPAA